MSTWPAIVYAFLAVMGGICLWTVAVVPLAVLVGRAIALSNHRRENQ